MFDNIAAISSGSKVNQPISIIRVSGPDAVEIVKKVYKGRVGRDHEITYGKIQNNQGEMVDEVLVMWFVGKEKDGEIVYNNYVGEPLVEINAHGGIVVTNRILELLLANGARLATPGEFTRRAFLNGKLDLVKAEAIHDIIMAKTTKQTQITVAKLDGKTSSKLDVLENKLSYLIGLLEVNIDYPEYDDIEVVTDNEIRPKVAELVKEMNEIVHLSERSKYIFEGVNVAILGKPNVGKSSILNALLSEEKAIVTDIAGTTRDLVEAAYQIDGLLFKLVDTAGLRKTEEVVEKIGIERSLSQIDKADVIIHVLDHTQVENEYDDLIRKEVLATNKFYLPVMNKSDLLQEKDQKMITVSAINKEISELENALVDLFKDIDVNDERLLSNTRQLSLIKKASLHLQEALDAIQDYALSFDVIIVDLIAAWEAMREIRGRVDKEDLLDTMFKNFCLGK
ncbi:tRNA uridine-5-carboxymethylaminomethyl(34) synthesis GTPase MnmE [Mycoplasma sp. Ms02]|uniref:tRNA uridine-5-carboxymethylaminomethyl(34) synthesis GTPase MnmE n=1 Tax=Mycoplasma sp. Ms02 TaxID=353851 RepID=UPI001C8AA4D2|nr:tRNA uridine-5-carboxymethylaminomethyl(34) synthesis GTPase MnmE [Mycoplasma sp. Ms02]QZE12057.1 tRNA uridine-5-carboxymethylaminomethyl(34) synthesis GTPase MnmE [Mycoplasma sp. Ms02]